MDIVIRQATTADAPALDALHKESRLAAYPDIVEPHLLEHLATADLAERWTERLSSEPPPDVFVATRNNTPVGYCMLVPAEDRVAELTRMSVSPEAWGTGVGSALTRHALDHLRRDRWTTVVLWVLVRNEAAQAFYRTLGFEPDGATQVDSWTGLTQVRMRLSLALQH